jgi:hypothetical protein
MSTGASVNPALIRHDAPGESDIESRRKKIQRVRVWDKMPYAILILSHVLNKFPPPVTFFP